MSVLSAPENQFDTEFITKITTNSHRVKWTIGNVTDLVDEIKSPDFYLPKSYVCCLSFHTHEDVTCIRLYNKSEKAIEIEWDILVVDDKGTTYIHTKSEFGNKVEKDEYFDFVHIDFLEEYYSLENLTHNKLTIFCTLKSKKVATTKVGKFQFEANYRDTLLNDFKTMFNNPEGSDFTLQIGDEFIYAHKAVLRFRSEYFKKMFQSQMKEKAQNFVLITDMPYSSMKNLIEFLYTGEINEEVIDQDVFLKEVMNLHVAADKYQVIELKSFCVSKLISMVTVDNILEILNFAARWNEENIKIEAMNFISHNFDEVSKTNSWKKFLSNEVDLASEVVNFSRNSGF